MRIFVSSTMEDLREHRTAAIRVLRQLGHEVLAMEDMVAGSAAPLAKVVEMIDRSDAYLGVFAWRYGYVPKADARAGVDGQTSITHYEYLRAQQRDLPIMAFLLDEQYAWPPQLVDGFNTVQPEAPKNTERIRELRRQLQQERVVSTFTTPSDLEARVSAAVTMAGLTRQLLDLQPATALDPNVGVPGDTSTVEAIKGSIVDASKGQSHAMKISLDTEWWSTRLYLIANLAENLTEVRRIVIVQSAPAVATPAAAVPMAAAAGVAAATSAPVSTGPLAEDERFVGLLSTGAIVATIGPRVPAISNFRNWLQQRQAIFDEVSQEAHAMIEGFHNAFGDSVGKHFNEAKTKATLTPELLRRWFRETMLQHAVHISDLQRASVVDLLRLLDYPNEYVPVLTRRLSKPGETKETPVSKIVDVMDKKALNARLARSYLVELMDRARIT